MDTETTADRVVRFAREIDRALTPWQEWIVRAYLDSPRKPLTCENPVITRDRGASL